MKIFILNYDWNDMQRTDVSNFRDKLVRDRLEPDKNQFFFFSWSEVSYETLSGDMQTVHKRTRLFKLKPLLDLKAIVSVSLAVRKYGVRPDAWMTYDFGMLPALWVAKKLYGGKVVININNQPRIYSRTRRFGFIKSIYSWMIEKMWWRLADHFFTISDLLKQYLMDIGVPSERISVFYLNTIDRDLKLIERAKKNLIRKRYSIPPGSKVLITVARLEAEKNHLKLLELFAGLSNDHFLFIVGKGSLMEGLKNKTAALGISERVIFCGWLNRDEIWNYYLDSDLFVLLSKAEALGIVFWEAMYVNVPVLGSDADGIAETIGKDGERGRIWKSSEGQSGFIEKVSFCTIPSGQRDDMIKRARDFVIDQMKNEIMFSDLPIFRDRNLSE